MNDDATADRKAGALTKSQYTQALHRRIRLLTEAAAILMRRAGQFANDGQRESGEATELRCVAAFIGSLELRRALLENEQLQASLMMDAPDHGIYGPRNH